MSINPFFYSPHFVSSLSENQSLLVMPPWVNIWLLAAMALSMTLHFIILYIDILGVSYRVLLFFSFFMKYRHYSFSFLTQIIHSMITIFDRGKKCSALINPSMKNKYSILFRMRAIIYRDNNIIKKMS